MDVDFPASREAFRAAGARPGDGPAAPTDIEAGEGDTGHSDGVCSETGFLAWPVEGGSERDDRGSDSASSEGAVEMASDERPFGSIAPEGRHDASCPEADRRKSLGGGVSSGCGASESEPDPGDDSGGDSDGIHDNHGIHDNDGSDGSGSEDAASVASVAEPSRGRRTRALPTTHPCSLPATKDSAAGDVPRGGRRRRRAPPGIPCGVADAVSSDWRAPRLALETIASQRSAVSDARRHSQMDASLRASVEEQRASLQQALAGLDMVAGVEAGDSAPDAGWVPDEDSLEDLASSHRSGGRQSSMLLGVSRLLHDFSESSSRSLASLCSSLRTSQQDNPGGGAGGMMYEDFRPRRPRRLPGGTAGRDPPRARAVPDLGNRGACQHNKQPNASHLGISNSNAWPSPGRPPATSAPPAAAEEEYDRKKPWRRAPPAAAVGSPSCRSLERRPSRRASGMTAMSSFASGASSRDVAHLLAHPPLAPAAAAAPAVPPAVVAAGGDARGPAPTEEGGASPAATVTEAAPASPNEDTVADGASRSSASSLSDDESELTELRQAQEMLFPAMEPAGTTRGDPEHGDGSDPRAAKKGATSAATSMTLSSLDIVQEDRPYSPGGGGNGELAKEREDASKLSFLELEDLPATKSNCRASSNDSVSYSDIETPAAPSIKMCMRVCNPVIEQVRK